MPRQSNGSYIQPGGTQAVSGQPISSTSYNSLITDIGTELTNSLDRLGRGAMEAALNMGGFKLTNAADPVSAQDGVTLNYLNNTFSVSSSKVIAWLGYTPANLAGDTFTGTVNVAPAAGGGNIFLKKTASSGMSVNVYGALNATTRWGIALGDATAESGGNAGSNFAIVAFNDAGSPNLTPVSINRATGLLSIGNGLSVAGGAALDSLTVSGTAAFSGATTAPTQTATDNSTKVATTAFAQAAISYVIGNAPSLGSPTTNAPSAGDNSARIPNTAWVWGNVSTIIAGVTFLDLGDFALAQYSGGGTVNAGASIAASNLFVPGAGPGNVGATPTGTWRCQGFALASPSTNTLVKRIL